MQFRFLLSDVDINIVEKISNVEPVLYEDYHTKANANQFCVFVPDVADIYAENGNSIQIAPHGEPNKDAIELYLNGSVFGSILHQRGILPIHASSVGFGDKAILICGDSGAGKSTMAFGLSRLKGCELITDDITPVSEKQVIPTTEWIKLWKDSAENFELDTDQMKQVRSEINKYFVPIKNGDKRSIDIGGIIFIVSTDNSSSFEPVEGAEKFNSIKENVYWHELMNSIPDLAVGHFKELSELSSSLPFYTFDKSKNDSIDQNVHLLHNFIEQTIL